MDHTKLMIVSSQSQSHLDSITIHKIHVFARGMDCYIRWLQSETQLYNCVLTAEYPYEMLNGHIVIDGTPKSLVTWFMEYTKELQSVFHDTCLDRTDLPLDLQKLTKKFL